MKKKLCLMLVLVFTLCFVFASCAQSTANDGYLRIHIRANSNSQQDQEVKYKVKTAVVEFLMPLLANVNSKEEAKQTVLKNTGNLQNVANGVLLQNGFSYASSAAVKKEEFPTRTYEGLTLDSGVYDALIINLGTGTGDNWWCVVYPPLCFVGGEATGGAIKYKSKLLEIINDFFGGQK